MFAARKQNRTCQRRTHLVSEELEGRCLPSKYAWAPPPGAPNLDFNIAANWAKWDPAEAEYIRTPSVPGYSDDVWLIDSLAIANENGDQPQDFNRGMRIAPVVVPMALARVRSVTIEPEFTAEITLQDHLIISGVPTGGSTPTSILTMSSATIAGAGGNLVLNPGSKFEWSGGTLRDLSVKVEAASATRPSAQVVVEDKAAASGPLMLSSGFDVKGELWWRSANVNCDLSAPAGKPPSAIHVHDGGTFLLTAGGRTWGTDSNNLVVTNRGTVTVISPSTATLNGSYTTLGRTILTDGTFLVNGEARQHTAPAVFALQGGNYRAGAAATSALAIWEGQLIGTGTINGNLILGNNSGGSGLIAPGDIVNFIPTPEFPTPTISGIGSIDVTGTLDILTDASAIVIDIAGPSLAEHDQIRVVGQTALTGKVYGNLRRPHNAIPAYTRIVFLKYASRSGDFTGGIIPDGWTKDKDEVKYWLQPPNTRVRGRVANDADGDGKFEPQFGETVLAGVQVELLDQYGEPVAEPTTTDASGYYDFGAVEYGDYQVRFTRPSHLRPVMPGAGDDETADSDYDYATLTAGVTIDEANPFSNPSTDALFRPLTAVNDDYHVLSGSTSGGDVRLNDPPAAGDTLTFAHVPESGPALGTLVFSSDGTFVYIAPVITGPAVVVSFQYLVTDSYGHTATATVYITIHPQSSEGGGDPPPPPP